MILQAVVVILVADAAVTTRVVLQRAFVRRLVLFIDCFIILNVQAINTIQKCSATALSANVS